MTREETPGFYFYTPSGSFIADDARNRVAMIPAGLTDTRELLTIVGRQLAFPAHYGKNLDAFWDCVTDPEYITVPRVLVVHGDLPAIPEAKLKGYIEVLRDAALYWKKPDSRHAFEVWFPVGAQIRIMSLLAALPPAAG